MPEWNVVTCEYPPQPGGVSDYTYAVAGALAGAGDCVHVWCPGDAGVQHEPPDQPSGVMIHRHVGGFRPRGLRRVGRLINQRPSPRHFLVQWVPHGYGYRSMNLPFCLWLWGRAAFRGDRIDIMVHEAYLAFGEGSWRQNVAALVHRVMTVVLLRAARRVFTSIPEWINCWRPWALGKSISLDWVPVPSTIPPVDDREAVLRTRSRYVSDGGQLIGHFGAYSKAISKLLVAVIPKVLERNANCGVLFVGRDGESFRQDLLVAHAHLGDRTSVSGYLSAPDVSRHLLACDLMLQPYPDGVSTRRTSAMAALSHGLPMVTTRGRVTESLWIGSGAAVLADPGDAEVIVEHVDLLLTDPARRRCTGLAAKTLYDDRFDIRHTVAAVRGTPIRPAGMVP